MSTTQTGSLCGAETFGKPGFVPIAFTPLSLREH